ncbi:SURF1 family protein [Sphingomonas glaciei]|uniref:SURF1-like protein n=1 Tax=Sphingomonas glaciei TaxID=2938948 RepID=A0ABY5MSI1_9SPHN|nr:SURF1 family protein [Sphingomonas glaciei]UUR07088.1 SURF1 family protein [Sphingomonas glaciei]
MKRVPIFATLVVLVAVATMVGLGIWQLGRADEKEAAILRIAANVQAAPVAVTRNLDLQANLFRPVRVVCRGGSPTRLAGAGKFGFRVIGDCDAGLAAPLPVQLGTVRQPAPTAAWAGGTVLGYLAQAPDSRSLLRQLFDRSPAGIMVVANPPLAGLTANPPADLEGIPNNHRSYAVQWFAFAAIALVIYVLALRRRAQ